MRLSPCPREKPLVGTGLEIHELRWPSLPQGSGPSATLNVPIIRILYGYARPVRTPNADEVAVILLGGNKSPTAARWYDSALPEAERRLVEWCDEHLAFVPRESYKSRESYK